MIPRPRNINAASRLAEHSLTIISFSRGYSARCLRAMKTTWGPRKPWDAKADTGIERLPSGAFAGCVHGTAAACASLRVPLLRKVENLKVGAAIEYRKSGRSIANRELFK